ncbi:S-layer homology domain-containing protein [Solibacillus sp. CAU 1738]|uniref:S-layer homology domain-containing protein n=1 Tax=Solibacillus sp. CAU 1738 TaxID=3140363 RepID=UPI0032619594
MKPSLYENNIITGITSSSTFKPNQEATRGEAALFLANALELHTKNVNNPGFKDVPITSEYYGAIAALYEAGIVGGYGDMFRPDTTLTRAQLAKMITIGFNLQKASNANTKFTDVNRLTDANTKYYIQTLVDYNITRGTTTTTFSPNQNLTRGQLATFLFNAMNAVNEFEVISIK